MSSADAATKQSNFEQAVAFSLHLWPALSLAVENQWGGSESTDKRDWFAGATVDLFPPILSNTTSAGTQASGSTSNKSSANDDSPLEEPDTPYLEEFLLQVMLDEFEVNIDDDSAFEVADQIIRLRSQCLKGQFAGVEDLQRRWEARRGKKAGGQFQAAQDQDQDTDWSDTDDDDEDEEGDIQMDEAPALVAVKKDKAREEPEVDDEGFTKVTRKKR